VLSRQPFQAFLVLFWFGFVALLRLLKLSLFLSSPEGLFFDSSFRFKSPNHKHATQKLMFHDFIMFEALSLEA
jgi:hypothetical protein